MSGAKLCTPTDRTCELCGRRETWDADAESWRAVEEGGERREGKAFCIHEWDINGRFVPFEGDWDV